MPNKSIKELEDEAEKYFKSAKRWENVAKGAKVAETALGVGAAVGGPMALVGRAALKKGMKAGAKKMMGGGTSKGSDLLKKSIVNKNKLKAPTPKDVAAKYVKDFNAGGFKNRPLPDPRIRNAQLGGVLAGGTGGFIGGYGTGVKQKPSKKSPNLKAAASVPAAGVATKAVKPTKAPRATAVARPLKSDDSRFRAYTPKLGGYMEKLDEKGNPVGKPYYVAPRRK